MMTEKVPDPCPAQPAQGRWLTRRAVILCLLTVLVWIIYLGYVFDYQHAVIGYYKGQVCYHGLPADYWAARIRNYRGSHNSVGDYWILAWFYHLVGWSTAPKPPLTAGDRDSLPILLALKGDAHPVVRQFALYCLADIQPTTEETIDALIAGLDDPDLGVQFSSMDILASCGPAARKALPRIIEEFEKWERRSPQPSFASLDTPMLPKDYQQLKLSEAAGRALQSIDPDEAKKRGL
jgi:hypothetical protein